ncbi:MAG TPA: hypothetical protein VFN44_18185, partial [Solirubrobacteraceae bacterium]|nr:hypothetical protein [Solirubrobacteraceae bacterium]
FGIVYPPAYARQSPVTHDRMRMECVVDGGSLSATVRCLAGTVELPELGEVAFELGGVRGRARLEYDGDRMAMEVVNETEVPEDIDRAEALRHSLLSTHLLARVDGGRFTSPLLAQGCEQVNTWPVLATEADDAVLGAAIMLPDHPQLAPESRGGMFDSTEIEEALLLHVMALSDAEREQATDPAVRAMIERVATTTPEELMALHGRVTMRDPEHGEREATVAGVTYRPGDTVVLRPGPGRNAQDHLVQGRPATVERIYVDFDGRVQLAVTVDGVPGQDIMRDIRRYLFFRPDEVERA